MNFDGVRAAFAVRIGALWSATEVAWPGEDFDVPADPWLRFTLLPEDADNACIGGSLVLQYGTAIAQIFIPFGRGCGQAYQLADSFAALFQNTSFDGVTVEAVSMQTLGDDGRGWYQVNVIMPYWAQ